VASLLNYSKLPIVLYYSSCDDSISHPYKLRAVVSTFVIFKKWNGLHNSKKEKLIKKSDVCHKYRN